jgi:hypothetical protein
MYTQVSIDILDGRSFTERNLRAAAFRRAMQQCGGVVTGGDCYRALSVAVASGRLPRSCKSVDAAYAAVVVALAALGTITLPEN